MQKQKFKIDWTKTLGKIKEQTNSNKGSGEKDERIFSPQFNENGVSQTIVRFLPSKDTDIPFVSFYHHYFKGPGGWLIDNCPTTLKKECPVCKANSDLWDSDPTTVRTRKRKLNYYSNILIVKDPLNPENNGKVFLYKYGAKVYDKIMEKMQPGDDSIDQPIMVFDYYEGADFKLIIKKIKVDGIIMPNYDSCQFDNMSCVGTDDEIESINSKLYGLADFISPDKFKSFEDLSERFNKVIGMNGSSFQKESFKPANHVEENNSAKQAPAKVADANIFAGNDDDFFKELQDES